MGKLYAYARVSFQSQRLDRQIRNILNYLGEERALIKLFKEKYTGTKLDRPGKTEKSEEKMINPGVDFLWKLWKSNKKIEVHSV